MTAISPRRMFRAVWKYKAWIPIALVLGPLWTAVHEGAHAVMVIAQGGTILDWSMIPGRDPEGNFRFGYVTNTIVGSQSIVLVGPALVSLLLAFPCALLLRQAPPGRASRFGFLMGVLFPLGDLSLGVAGLVFSREDADLARVFGAAPLIPALLLVALMIAAGVLARPAFERHFETGLTRPEYFLLGGLVVGAPWAMGVLMLVA